MKNILFTCLVACLFSGIAWGNNYSREELEAKSKDELVEIVIEIQENGRRCWSFQAVRGEGQSRFVHWDRSGFPYWPDGTKMSETYPDGSPLYEMITREGFTHLHPLWPNGTRMATSVRHYRERVPGYKDWKLPDGRPWPEDPPQRLYRGSGFKVEATRYPDRQSQGFVRFKTTFYDVDYTIRYEFNLFGNPGDPTNSSITECQIR